MLIRFVVTIIETVWFCWFVVWVLVAGMLGLPDSVHVCINYVVSKGRRFHHIVCIAVFEQVAHSISIFANTPGSRATCVPAWKPFRRLRW